MTDPFAEVLKGLRRDYLKESSARVTELRELMAAVESGAGPDALRRALHRLAGSGGSYGFDEVSRSSRAGEQVARRLTETGAAPTAEDFAALRGAVEEVARLFDEARAAEDSTG